MFTLHTPRENYLINAQGEITRAACDWQYSGKWIVLAMVRHNNFGRTVEFIRFADWSDAIKRLDAMPEGSGWYHNNGKSKWRLLDLDHGTKRLWGEPIARLYIGDLTSRSGNGVRWPARIDEAEYSHGYDTRRHGHAGLFSRQCDQCKENGS
jgi:hypothetical protein